MNMLTSMLTESDNVTHDLYRYLSLLTILVALGLSVYTVVWIHQPFDIQSYGIGYGALFVGMGAAMRLKQEAHAVAVAHASGQPTGTGQTS